MLETVNNDDDDGQAERYGGTESREKRPMLDDTAAESTNNRRKVHTVLPLPRYAFFRDDLDKSLETYLWAIVSSVNR